MRKKSLPRCSLCLLGIVILACLLAQWIAPYSATFMDSKAVYQAPSLTHLMGTDSMGRDLFSLMLYGGRESLFIGLLSTLISTSIAILYGTLSGLASERIDDVMMRSVELFMSVPSILLVIFLQAMWGTATGTSLAVVIGCTSWFSMTKIIRSEVRQIKDSDYMLAARSMGAGFGYMLWRHLLPNFIPSIMFMVVSSIGQAMITESTLSFLGLGLPLTTLSWGSLLSLSQGVILTGYWWIVLLPGVVLVTTLVCITQIGEYVRGRNTRLHSNL